ncbi:hypothetical protein [Streptomyces adelaidensis]|uniref:hypothetical protein n=1 Tax=Streptomyces adelaidensis TaxID=2796465 RepID=UPI0019054B7C|nr:hypothetical protein [Streptomyces adelaidensis]
MALEDAHWAQQPQTEEQGSATAMRIYTDWQAQMAAAQADPTGNTRAAPDPLSFIASVAADEPVTGKERGPARAFWSWRSQPEGASREVGHRFLAQACGESRGLQVLEDTPAGRKLDSYWLGERVVREALARDFQLDLTEVEATAGQVWKTVSGRYAEAAQGPVVAFAADIGADSVLGADELPRLLAHGKVGKENIKFPIDMPRHEQLPSDIDQLLGDETMRSQWRMEDIDPGRSSPKDLAQKLGSMDVPEQLKGSHEAALWRLGLADSYEELNARAAASQRVPANEFLPGVDVRPVARPAAPRGPTAGHGTLSPAAVLTLPSTPAPAQQPTGVER